MFSLQRTQQHSKATCPLEFIFQVLSSLPKRALSSLQVAGNQNRERKKQAGRQHTKHCFGVGGWAAPVKTYGETPCVPKETARGIPPAHSSAQHRTPSQVWWLLLWLAKRKGKKVGSPCWIW